VSPGGGLTRGAPSVGAPRAAKPSQDGSLPPFPPPSTPLHHVVAAPRPTSWCTDPSSRPGLCRRGRAACDSGGLLMAPRRRGWSVAIRRPRESGARAHVCTSTLGKKYNATKTRSRSTGPSPKKDQTALEKAETWRGASALQNHLVAPASVAPFGNGDGSVRRLSSSLATRNGWVATDCPRMASANTSRVYSTDDCHLPTVGTLLISLFSIVCFSLLIADDQDSPRALLCTTR